MTVRFTEEELEWIVKDFGNWHLKEGCPEELKEDIAKKLEYLKRQGGQKWRR